MTENGSKESHLSIDSIGPDLLRDSDLQLNVRQTIIVVTEDKALLCLKDHEEYIGRRREWVAPASALAAIVLTLVSADFNDALGIGASVWTALFLLLAAAAFIWLVISLSRMRARQTPEDVVRLLMAAGHVEQLGKPTKKMATSIEGVWKGHLLYGDERYEATLELSDEDEVVTGSLVVVDSDGKDYHQSVEGTLDGNWLTLKGNVDDETLYTPDNLSVEILKDSLKGGCGDAHGKTGTAEFRRGASHD